MNAVYVCGCNGERCMRMVYVCGYEKMTGACDVCVGCVSVCMHGCVYVCMFAYVCVWVCKLSMRGLVGPALGGMERTSGAGGRSSAIWRQTKLAELQSGEVLHHHTWRFASAQCEKICAKKDTFADSGPLKAATLCFLWGLPQLTSQGEGWWEGSWFFLAPSGSFCNCQSKIYTCMRRVLLWFSYVTMCRQPHCIWRHRRGIFRSHLHTSDKHTPAVSAHRITPRHTAPYHVIRYHTTSCIILHHTTLYHIIPHHATSYRIIPHPTTSYRITPHHTTSYRIIPHRAASYGIIPYHATSHHTTTYRITPSCTMIIPNALLYK